MRIRNVGFALLAALVCGLCGCGKRATARPASAPAREETVAQVHWLGKKRVAADTNAASLMGVWTMPQSARLERQTLDKLAVAAGRMFSRGANASAARDSALRPLLDDLLQEETVLEARRTKQQGEFALAVRVGADRARVWEANLASALGTVAGVKAAPDGNGSRSWVLPAGTLNYVEFTRSGGWVLVGAARSKNTLLADLLGRIQRSGTPAVDGKAAGWLTSDLSVQGLSSVLGWGLDVPEEWPRISLAMSGDGQSVRSRGQFKFSQPLRFKLEPWNIPTNIIHDPLVGFTALQGLAPALSSSKLWRELGLGPAPNQFFAWAQGLPFMNFMAAPLPTASNLVQTLAKVADNKWEPWVGQNAEGRFEPSDKHCGLAWLGLPLMMPQLHVTTTSGGVFLAGGVGPIATNRHPMPPELIHQVVSQTNLVGYDWEITEPRVSSLLYMGQLWRVIFKKAQLPADSAGLLWLTNAAPKLGNCGTVLTKTGPDQLSFIRRSSIGFTAFELHLLADWLESPAFPAGLHTFTAPPPPPVERRPRTNAPAASRPGTPPPPARK
jgi:hypothetical protein